MQNVNVKISCCAKVSVVILSETKYLKIAL